MNEQLSNAATGRHDILIVDDNPENLQVLGHILSENNLDVSFASSGKQALEAVGFEAPDLILLDVSMPGMDGYEVCREIKKTEELRDIPVIFLTAKTGSENIIRGFEAGAVDYVTKPFSSSELLSRVRTHLELKSSRDTIIRQKHELEEINNTKNRFFSILAHDLKSPFSTLITVTDYYKKSGGRFDEGEMQKFLDNIYEVSVNTYNLLENLLDWSRSQAGILEVCASPFDMKSIVRKNAYLVSARAESKGIRLNYDCPEGLMAMADPNMISTVVRNLLGNAVKYTRKGGTVSLECTGIDADVEVVVEDDGVGMTNAEQEKLFKTGSHLSKPGTAMEKGTGLGLILCGEFIGKNNGVISVQSRKGKGSRFVFRIPAAP